MSCAACRQSVAHSLVKVEDHGKSVIFSNSSHEEFFKTKVDDCLVKDEISADYVVSRIGIGDLIIEFKGRDVEHALDQIMATAGLVRQCEKPRGPLAGLVVCRQYPSFDTRVQKFIKRFATAYGGPVKIFTHKKTVDFPAMFEF